MNELDSQARELIGRALEGEGPTAAERSRLRGAVFARVGVGVAIVSALPGTAAATTAAAGATAGSAVAMGFATKLMAVIVLAGAVGAGGYVAVSSHRSAPRVSDPPTPTLSQAAPAAGRGAAGEGTTRSENPTATSISMLTAPPTPAATPTPTPTPTVSVSAPSAPDRSLAEETRALKSVITDLRDGQLDRALADIDAQDVRFQGGALAEERAEARITALCALGRNDEARADASRFLRAHPRSLLAGRVRASCGGDGSEVTR